MLGLNTTEIEQKIRQGTAAELAPIIDLLRETNEYLAAIHELLQKSATEVDSGT